MLPRASRWPDPFWGSRNVWRRAYTPRVVDTLVSIKVFAQVGEAGSFVAAAERLHLSTAMTTKHILHIEKRLGTRLLNRNSRSLSLTETGTLYLERCKVVLAALEEAELEVGSV